MAAMKLLLIAAFWLTVAAENRKVDLFGNATLGYYFVNVYVGPDHQKFSLIVDTGSSQSTLPCSECTQCNKGHYNSFYDHSKSPVFEYVNTLSYFGWHCDGASGNKCPFSVVGIGNRRTTLRAADTRETILKIT